MADLQDFARPLKPNMEEAAKLMKHWNIKHLPVVDKQGALVGLLDDRQIVYAVPKLMSIMEEFCRRK
ncbi:MAG: CBS domain-containing protein [Candidatus Bathyarchaeota archaeon]|nr:CBS domain-containing protein [Candidatus Bathyarchaeota archaeon]